MSDPASWDVVIADDDPDTVQIIERLLTSHGMRAHIVNNGPDCLQLLRERRATLLLLDIRMPGMSGWDVIKTIRQDDSLKDLLVAAITARTEPGIHEQVLDAGFDAYFAKPISPLIFLSDIETLIRSQGKGVLQSILLVDDDPSVGDMFQAVADFKHLDLTVATNAEAAYDYLSRAVPDVIVMDVFMPGIDGYQAFRHIRQQSLGGDRPIVAITAYYTSDTEQDVLAWGFNGFVAKPFDPSKLIPYLERVVKGQQAN